MGLKAKEYMDSGNLVPDEVIVGIIRDRLDQEDCEKGFILDGFPRTIAQAESLEEVLQNIGKKLDSVISFSVRDEELIARLTGRRICKSCGTSFHVKFNAPKQEGVCDSCGGELYIRKDDNEETAKNRLDVYKTQTAPLIDFYQTKGIFKEVDGEKAIDEITGEVISILEAK